MTFRLPRISRLAASVEKLGQTAATNVNPLDQVKVEYALAQIEQASRGDHDSCQEIPGSRWRSQGYGDSPTFQVPGGARNTSNVTLHSIQVKLTDEKEDPLGEHPLNVVDYPTGAPQAVSATWGAIKYDELSKVGFLNALRFVASGDPTHLGLKADEAAQLKQLIAANKERRTQPST